MIRSIMKGVLGFTAIGFIVWPWYGVWISLAIIQIRFIRLYAALVLLGLLGHMILLNVWMNQEKKSRRHVRAVWIVVTLVLIVGGFLIYYLPQRWL